MGVGSRIQERRRELDMSRSELANQVGIHALCDCEL